LHILASLHAVLYYPRVGIDGRASIAHTIGREISEFDFSPILVGLALVHVADRYLHERRHHADRHGGVSSARI